MQKSYLAKTAPGLRTWVVVDLENVPLGRACSKIAQLLRGKDKPDFTPYVDVGGFVIAVNASKIKLTGKKLDEKLYQWHTGFPGGLKTMKAKELLAKSPERLVKIGVWGMLPKNTLSRHILKKLKVYAGRTHPHTAQMPLEVKI